MKPVDTWMVRSKNINYNQSLTNFRKSNPFFAVRSPQNWKTFHKNMPRTTEPASDHFNRTLRLKRHKMNHLHQFQNNISQNTSILADNLPKALNAFFWTRFLRSFFVQYISRLYCTERNMTNAIIYALRTRKKSIHTWYESCEAKWCWVLQFLGFNRVAFPFVFVFFFWHFPAFLKEFNNFKVRNHDKFWRKPRAEYRKSKIAKLRPSLVFTSFSFV